MPDEEYARAKRDALSNAAGSVLDGIRRRSPSARIAESFRLSRRGDSIYLRSGDVSAWATDTNARHPFWGEWGSGPKVATNWANPDRTRWAERAVNDATDAAEDQFANEYLQRIALSSSLFDRS